MPPNNNRVEYDNVRPSPDLDDEEDQRHVLGRSGQGPALNPRFITRDQIMEANWRITERARMTEIARLKEAAAEDEREREAAAKTEQREKERTRPRK